MLVKKILGLLLLFIFSAHLSAQQPPIIDRELFFGDPDISGAQISPDGKYITFVKPFNNVRNIWVKERNQKFDEAKPLTADAKRPVTSYFWSRDSKYILFVQDQGGNENFRIYAVDPKATGDPVPQAKDLTPLENVRAFIYDVPKNSPNKIFIGLNDRNPQLHDIYKLDLTTGERTLIRKNDDNVASWVFDLNGNLKLGIRQTADGGTEILKVNGDKLDQIYVVNNEESAGPIRFMPDGYSFYMISNKGAKADKLELLIYDLNSGKTKFIEKDPKNEVDFGDVIFSDVTNELIATVYVGDETRIYFKNKSWEKDYNKLKSLLPKGEIGLVSTSDDESIWLVSVSRDVDPGSVYLFDRTKGTAELLYKSRPTLPSEYLSERKAVRYKVRDGMSIPAYLTLPKGIPAKNLPTVLFVHGGPWARDFFGYNATAQFLANRGYAVLQPNFRGSTGYGKKFLNAGNKQWGRGSMQHDLTDAVKWLIKQGIADPKRVAISGGSYGGYATLAGLTFTPDVYAAGFDIVGPSNIITLLKSIPPYWAPAKKMFDVRVGSMDIPEEKKLLDEVSPFNYATQIKAPLYVVQGANDPRVKKAEADQIVVALRDLNRQVEYMVAPDEGHGFAGKENRLAMYVAMEQFFAKHLKGRVQDDIRPEIQQKLKDITVDIKTVTMPKNESVEAPKEMLKSFDGSKIQEGNFKYAVKVNAMGQNFTMNLERAITKTAFDGKDVFLVVDNLTGMMAMKDSLYLDRVTVLPVKRMIQQGPATVELTFNGNEVTGKIVAGPQNMPVSAKADSHLLVDGSGIELPLRTLPLAEGYQASFNQLDIQAGGAKTMSLKVIGSENITVDAGAFDTYKVEIKPVEGDAGSSTLWVAKDSKVVVKTEAKLPATMGGGTVVSELTK